MKPKALALLVISLVTLVAAGCGSSSSPQTTAPAPDAQTAAPKADDAWKKVVDDANKEKLVTFYHNLRPEGTQDLIADFNKEYPNIKVEEVRLGSAQLNQKFNTETQAGKAPNDVLLTYYDEVFEQWIKQGWFIKWDPPELKAFPKEFNRDNLMFHVQTTREAIIYNTTKVKPEDAPKDWKDLFDPKWKGKIGMNQPWRSVAIQQVVAHWEKNVGIKDSATAMKAQQVKFYNGSSGVLQAVVTGEVQVAEITDLPIEPAIEEGRPIAVVYPSSGTPITAGFAMVPTKAPNPNAGKVFVNWLLSEKGQISLQKAGGLPVNRPGVPGPKHIPPTKDLKTIDGNALLTPSVQKELLDRWKSTFGVQ